MSWAPVTERVRERYLVSRDGIISPGKCRLGGIGGADPSEIYRPGTIGICSRSGGMSAEISLTLKENGFGVSTCVSMGGDRITGMRMADYLLRFEADPETEAAVLFGEPGTTNEQEAAEFRAARPGEFTEGRRCHDELDQIFYGYTRKKSRS